MRILVTGGAGFIGSLLVSRLLESGHEVVILDNLSAQVHGSADTHSPPQLPRGAEFVHGDVANLADWHAALKGVEVVVHFAAETGTGQSMYQIGHYNRVNSLGTALLFDALSENGYPVRKVVLASSRSIYGEGAYTCDCAAASERSFTPAPRSFEDMKAQQWEPRCPYCGEPCKVVATPEDARVHPVSMYAATKYAQEDIVRIGCDSLGISSVILRFQNVYGEGQSLNNPYTGILSIFSTRIRNGLDLPIFEDGRESRDFVHVADTVDAVILAIGADVSNGRVYNVGSGVATSVMTLAQKLVEEMQGSSKLEVTGQFRLGDIRHCYADISRIQQELGYQPRVSLEEGLRRFVGWAVQQPLPEDRLGRAMEELRERGLMDEAETDRD